MNRYAIARSRKLWADTAGWLAVDVRNRARPPIAELPWPEARVVVTHHYRVNRDRDLDNLTAGLKGILDGMKGILYRDDSARALSLTVREPVVGDRDGIELLISPRVATGNGAPSEASPVAGVLTP